MNQRRAGGTGGRSRPLAAGRDFFSCLAPPPMPQGLQQGWAAKRRRSLSVHLGASFRRTMSMMMNTERPLAVCRGSHSPSTSATRHTPASPARKTPLGSLPPPPAQGLRLAAVAAPRLAPWAARAISVVAVAHRGQVATVAAVADVPLAPGLPNVPNARRRHRHTSPNRQGPGRPFDPVCQWGRQSAKT